MAVNETESTIRYAVPYAINGLEFGIPPFSMQNDVLSHFHVERDELRIPSLSPNSIIVFSYSVTVQFYYYFIEKP